jgi:allantoinase
MSLPDGYLQYPLRRYGMDQGRYGWAMASERKPVAWPGGARIALLIVPALEFFPLDQPALPFRAPGGMVTPYPDLRHYTLRDYGNRVGVFRVFKALDRYDVKATVAINAKVAERYPFLVGEVTRRGWEVMAYGVDMGRLHYGGMAHEEEVAQVEEALATLRAASGQAVTGWLSPARSQSMNTVDLIAARGVEYVSDWISDDMPFQLSTESGEIVSLPLSHEIDDQTIMHHYQHSEAQFLEAVCDQFDVLYR